MEADNCRVSIGLLWHSLRSPNLGWGALTISHLAMLRRAAEEAHRALSVRVIGLEGPLHYPPADLPVEEVHIKPGPHVQMIPSLWRALSGCDIVMDIGGGDLFSDTYGKTAFAVLTYSKALVLMRRKPLILSPQTIGPFRSPYTRALAAQVARRCERIFTRDTPSISLLHEMGIRDGAEETVDVAYRLPFEREPRVPGTTIRIGLNVSGLLYQPALKKELSFGLQEDYPGLIERLISALMEQPNVSIVLVPHVLGGIDDDLAPCKALADKFRLALAPGFSSPTQAKSFISGLDLLIGSRMHATIAAISSGVPVVPLAYSRKFIGVFGSVGYPLVCDLRSLDADSVVSSVLGAITKLPELREAAVRGNAIAQDKLEVYQRHLVTLMRNLH